MNECLMTLEHENDQLLGVRQWYVIASIKLTVSILNPRY